MTGKPLLLNTSVTVNPGADAGGTPWYWLKIQTDAFELNVGVRPEEVARVERVRSTPWLTGALHVGACAGSRAFWCVGEDGDESVRVLGGHEDEPWDFAVSL